MTDLTRAARLIGYEDLARSVGVDPRQELRRVGIALRALGEPESLISYVAFLRLLENTAANGSCPDFGLRLARAQDLSSLGPLAVLVGHAQTLAEAAEFAGRYLFVHTPANRIGLAPVPLDPSQTDLTLSIETSGKAPRRQGFELSLAFVARVLQLLGGGRIRPRLALVPHVRLAPLSAYTAAFGCPVEFEAPVAGLRLATADLERPLPKHDPMLKRLAQAYLDQNFPKGQERIADSVRELVRQFLGVGQATQQCIAGALSIHPRSLQRRLENEGCRFVDIVDDVRRELLVQLLDRSARPNLAQVSLTLGYSEQAALSRSCRRWFDCSPTELHRRRQAAQRRA